MAKPKFGLALYSEVLCNSIYDQNDLIIVEKAMKLLYVAKPKFGLAITFRSFVLFCIRPI